MADESVAKMSLDIELAALERFELEYDFDPPVVISGEQILCVWENLGTYEIVDKDAKLVTSGVVRRKLSQVRHIHVDPGEAVIDGDVDLDLPTDWELWNNPRPNIVLEKK